MLTRSSKNILKTLALGAVLLMPLQASAYFTYDNKAKHPDGGKFICQAGLVNIGVPVGVTVRAGKGADIPLSKASMLLAPKNWDLESSVGNPRVSWGSEKQPYTWLSAFNDIGLENNLCVSVNWKQKVVYIDTPSGDRNTKYDNLTNPVIMAANAAESGAKIKAGKRSLAAKAVAKNKASAAKARNAAIAARSWVMREGDTLSQTIEKWSTRAGWKTSWEADYDYPVEYTVTVNGTFKEAVGKILNAYRHSNKALVSCMHGGNKVVEIKPRRGGFESSNGQSNSVCK